ncbi:L-arginine responsive protein LaoB [Escherichia coli]
MGGGEDSIISSPSSSLYQITGTIKFIAALWYSSDIDRTIFIIIF